MSQHAAHASRRSSEFIHSIHVVAFEPYNLLLLAVFLALPFLSQSFWAVPGHQKARIQNSFSARLELVPEWNSAVSFPSLAVVVLPSFDLCSPLFVPGKLHVFRARSAPAPKILRPFVFTFSVNHTSQPDPVVIFTEESQPHKIEMN
jgi:hypothetical protein